MARHAATTLKDIAREVGVSTMAVSTVIHGRNTTVRVSDETRQRIKEVAERLRYRPNIAARGLSQQRMNAIGIVAMVGGSSQNLYFMEVLNGILAGSVTARQNTTILPVERWDEEEKILGFCDGRVDGLILIGAYASQEFVQTLRKQISLVTVQSNGLHPGVPFLDVNNEAGGYLATRYLLSQGHRRILHLATPPGIFGADLRCQGYCRALREESIAITPERILRPQEPFFFSVYDGYRTMKDYLEKTDRRNLPTALFCASDALAQGCIEALKDGGLHAPDDISVVGFDDLLTAQIMSPPLTTIRQPFQEIGRRSVERLMDLIRSESDSETDLETVKQDFPEVADILPVELVIRQSVLPVVPV